MLYEMRFLTNKNSKIQSHILECCTGCDGFADFYGSRASFLKDPDDIIRPMRKM